MKSIIENVIEQLLNCGDPNGAKLGSEVKNAYETWKKSKIYDRKSFVDISDMVIKKRKEILKYTLRADTTIKMMRGKLLEEYVSVLLGTVCNLDARKFSLFRDENLVIWKGLLPKNGGKKKRLIERELKIRHDIVVGREENKIKKPYLIIECSRWLDLSILSKLAFRFLITKRINPTTPCIIVTEKKGYKREYENFLTGVVDEIFDVSSKDEVYRLRDYVNGHLDEFT